MAKRMITFTFSYLVILLVVLIDCGTTIAQNNNIDYDAYGYHRSLPYWDETEEEELLKDIRHKLFGISYEFQFIDDDNSNEENENEDGKKKKKVLSPHQFLHLHHMKTGGTSMDHFLKCARQRLIDTYEYDVPYYSIHECNRYTFKKCVANETYSCRGKMDESAMMSYCAPLRYLNLFHWWDGTVHDEQRSNIPAALTILRHPIDRVWSMFRFSPKLCYKCTNLTKIYHAIDNNATKGYDQLCLAQLQNHEVENLVTSDYSQRLLDAEGNAEETLLIREEMLSEAIHNMKTFFTIIGLTEELSTTFDILGQVFPWMAMEIPGSDTVCRLPHDNASPANNHCIPPEGKGKPSRHWDLPSKPDPTTRQSIIDHNQWDIRLYEAAVQYFQLQLRVIEEGKSG